MKEELEKILTNLKDAGCGSGEVEKAKQLYESGDTKALLRSMNQAIQKLCSATSENVGAAGWRSSMRASGKWTAWIF